MVPGNTGSASDKTDKKSGLNKFAASVSVATNQHVRITRLRSDLRHTKCLPQSGWFKLSQLFRSAVNATYGDNSSSLITSGTRFFTNGTRCCSCLNSSCSTGTKSSLTRDFNGR